MRATDNMGKTLLHYAALSGAEHVIRIVLNEFKKLSNSGKAMFSETGKLMETTEDIRLKKCYESISRRRNSI